MQSADMAQYVGIGKVKDLKIIRWYIHKASEPNTHYIITHLFPYVLWHSNWLETQCWMRWYEYAKGSRTICAFLSQFYQDAWVATWNKIQRNILEHSSCAHCNQHLPHIFKKSCKYATNCQWGGWTWPPPTGTCSHWPLSWVKHWAIPFMKTPLWHKRDCPLG